MSDFDCDSPAVATALREINKLVEGSGAYVNPKLRIVQRGDSLSLETPGITGDGSNLIVMPESCLVPAEALRLGLNGESLVLEGTEEGLSPLRKQLAELMVEVYNRTGKIGHYLRTHPKHTLRNEPEILKILLRMRSNAFEDVKSNPLPSDLIGGFLQTRTLNFQRKENPGKGAQGKGMKVLMPLIDYANHNGASPGFRLPKTSSGGTGVGLPHSTAIEGSSECTVSYGSYELFDTYASYGFFDSFSPARHVLAAPCELTVDGFQSVLVNSRPALKYKGGLAPANKDLRNWLPGFKIEPGGPADLGHLKIPSRNSWRVLRRVLRVVFGRMNPNLSVGELHSVVETAESQVLVNTVEYYRQLKSAAEAPVNPDTDREALAELALLCNEQLTRLGRYRSHHKLKAV